MARKGTQPQKNKKESFTHSDAADIFQQMEDLQHELLVLAQRAEDELESALREQPEPLIRMLSEFAARVQASKAAVAFDAPGQRFTSLSGFQYLDLLENDQVQGRLALSGREMSLDFSQSRIFLPVVVFENPVALAVFQVPNLNSRSYEHICAAARECICKLRSDLKIPRAPRVVSNMAS